jgi:hypothetical protein
VDDDYLSVEDRPFDRNIEGFGDDRKTVCPVVTVAGVDPGALIYVDLQPVAVILDLWGAINPGISEGTAPSTIRAMKRVCVRLAITQLTKRQCNKKTPAEQCNMRRAGVP